VSAAKGKGKGKGNSAVPALATPSDSADELDMLSKNEDDTQAGDFAMNSEEEDDQLHRALTASASTTDIVTPASSGAASTPATGRGKRSSLASSGASSVKGKTRGRSGAKATGSLLKTATSRLTRSKQIKSLHSKILTCRTSWPESQRR